MTHIDTSFGPSLLIGVMFSEKNKHIGDFPGKPYFYCPTATRSPSRAGPSGAVGQFSLRKARRGRFFVKLSTNTFQMDQRLRTLTLTAPQHKAASTARRSSSNPVSHHDCILFYLTWGYPLPRRSAEQILKKKINHALLPIHELSFRQLGSTMVQCK